MRAGAGSGTLSRRPSSEVCGGFRMAAGRLPRDSADRALFLAL